MIDQGRSELTSPTVRARGRVAPKLSARGRVAPKLIKNGLLAL